MNKYFFKPAFLLAVIFSLALTAAAQPGSHYEKMQPRRPGGGNVQRPPSPGGNAVWIEEDWKWNNGRYAWGGGYWSRPPYADGMWMPGRWVHSRFGWQWMPGKWVRKQGRRRPHH